MSRRPSVVAELMWALTSSNDPQCRLVLALRTRKLVIRLDFRGKKSVGDTIEKRTSGGQIKKDIALAALVPMITERLKRIAAAASVGGRDRINSPNCSLLTGAKITTRHALSSARVSRSWQRCCCRNAEIQMTKSKPIKRSKARAPRTTMPSKSVRSKRSQKRTSAGTDESPPAPRVGSKLAALVALLLRPEGATIEQMSELTGWQNHSVRGAISGALKKKLGLAVVVEKEEGQRAYRLAEGVR